MKADMYSMTQVTLENIYKELKTIKSELDFIKEHMVDVDMILTKEEEERLNKSIEEKKAGKTISLEKLESELK